MSLSASHQIGAFFYRRIEEFLSTCTCNVKLLQGINSFDSLQEIWYLGQMNSPERPRFSLGKLAQIREFLGNKVVFYFFLSALTGFAFSGAELVFAFAIQALLVSLKIMDPSLASLPEWFPVLELEPMLLALFSIGTVRALTQWAQVYVRGLSLEETKYLQRTRVLRWAFFSNTVSSARASSLFSEFINNHGVAVMAVQALLVKGSVAVVLLASMVSISPETSGIVLLSLAFIAVPIKLLNNRIYAFSTNMKERWQKTNEHLLGSIKNLVLIQILGTQLREESKAQATLREYKRGFSSYHFSSGFLLALPQVFGIGLTCYLAYSASKGSTLAAGALMSYLYLLLRFTQTLSDISGQASYLTLYRPQVSFLYQWWKTEYLASESQATSFQAEPKFRDPEQFFGGIGWNLKNVTYSYDSQVSPVLTSFSLNIRPNSALVISGPSGSGKTTLLGLLLGYLTPQRGSVELIGASGGLGEVSTQRKTLLREIGYVGPEPFMIEGTIRENLAYGQLNKPTEQEIREALEKACCDFVCQLRDGIEHRISEQGTGLSAGQKQRLSLARALLRKPKVLLLDEATSNLDSETETKIIESLYQLKSKLTLVIVSHREALLPLGDEKLVLR